MLVSAATLIVSFPTFAGDYLTNTNQNAAFLRMIARGASIDVDGVYSNPAGLTFTSPRMPWALTMVPTVINSGRMERSLRQNRFCSRDKVNCIWNRSM